MLFKHHCYKRHLRHQIKKNKNKVAMKGRYITTQILLACLSKPVSKPRTKVSYPTTRIIVTNRGLEPMIKSTLIEA